VTFNHGVEGSSPSALTKNPNKTNDLKGGAQSRFLLRKLCPHHVRKRLFGIWNIPRAQQARW
jgi:hypothetical protein